MAGSLFKNLNVLLTANVSPFQSSLRTAARSVNALNAEVSALNKTSTGAGATGSKGLNDLGKSAEGAAAKTALLRAGMIGLGVAAVAGVASAVRATVEFDRSMHNVISLMTSGGESADTLRTRFNVMSTQVLDLSKTLPQGPNDLAKGLYDIVSAGIPASQAMDVLKQSASAASAGLSTTAEATQAITGVMNAYGPSAGNAAHISDILFQTVNVGVVSFQQLAQNIGQVIGMAAAAKVPIQDVGSAIAAMTRAGIVPAEAMTSLNRLIQGLIEPNAALSEAYKHLGIDSGAAALQQLGLYGVMEKLRTATGGSATATLSLFNDIRAARGAFALASNDGRTYADTQKAITDASQVNGATQRALAEQSKSLGFQFDVLRNNATALGISITRDATPSLVGLTRGLSDVIRVFAQNRQEVELLSAVLAVRFIGSIGAVRGGLALASTQIRAFGTEAAVSMGLLQTGAVSAGTAAKGLFATLTASPLALFAIGVAAVSFEYSRAQKAATAFAAEVAKPADAGTMQGVDDALQKTQTELDTTEKRLKELKSSAGTPADFISGALGQDSYSKEKAKVEALQKSLANLKNEQSLLVQDGKAASQNPEAIAGWMNDLAGNSEAAQAAMKQVEQETQQLQSTFAKWSSAGSAFSSALSDAQQEASAAASNSKKQSAAELKQQKSDLATRQQADLQALQDQKANITNRTKGSTDGINKEIASLKTKQKAERDALSNTKATNDASAQSTSNAADNVTVSLDRWTAKLAEQNKSLERFQANLVTIASKYGERVAKEFESLGPEAAPLIQQFANSTGAQAAAARDQILKSLDLKDAAANIDAALTLASIAAGHGADQIGLNIIAGLKGHLDEVYAIAQQYKIDLTTLADPVLDALGFKRVDKANVVGPFANRSGSVVVPKAEGGYEDHSAQIAKGGEMRLWAEPETQGESYIPHAPSKRGRSVEILSQTADLFGLSLVDARNGGYARAFANGAVLGPYGIPKPPTFPPYPLADPAAEVAQASYEAVQKKIAAVSAAAAAGGPAGAAPPGQIVNWIHAAEAIAGWPDTFTNGLYQLIMHESGGNPAAINLSDSNARAGHPSQGLMQTIPGTFNAYAWPGHHSITNPVDNILAGTSYALRNYGPGMIIAGGRHDAKGNYLGYANGGFNRGTYDSGGALLPGWTMAYNGTGKTEHVFTSEQFDRLVSAVAQGNGPNIVVNETVSAEETARVIARKFRG